VFAEGEKIEKAGLMLKAGEGVRKERDEWAGRC